MLQQQNRRKKSVSFRFGDRDFKIFGIEGDYIFEKIKKTKTFYEIDLLNYLTFVYKKLDLIIDVGANIGNHSVFFGSILANKVISIEPNPVVASILEENLEKNLINSLVISKGLSFEESKNRLNISYSKENLGMSKIDPNSSLQDSIEIELTSLDSLTEEYQLNKIDLIKIDIEGYEMNALKGAVKTLDQGSFDLLVEISDLNLKKDFDEFLSKYDYKAVTRWGATDMWHYTKKGFLFSLKCKFYWYIFKVFHKVKNPPNARLFL